MNQTVVNRRKELKRVAKSKKRRRRNHDTVDLFLMKPRLMMKLRTMKNGRMELIMKLLIITKISMTLPIGTWIHIDGCK